MIVKFNTKEVKGLFVKVPDAYKNFVVKQYSVAGTWVMETDSKELNHWKIQIPKGKYGIVGFFNSLKESEVEVHLKMSMPDYLIMLSEKDITVNYSKYTGQWLVLLER